MGILSEDDLRFIKPQISSRYLGAVKLRCARDDRGRFRGFVGVTGENIDMLFVQPDDSGTGIGRLLFHSMSEFGARKLDVNEQSLKATGFYGHMGFRNVGHSPKDGSESRIPCCTWSATGSPRHEEGL